MTDTNYEPKRCDHCDRTMLNNPIKVEFEGYCIKINGELCQRCNMIVERLIDRLDYEISN